MSTLQSTRLKDICPDTWVARAYGEYMSDCAAAQADLLSEITSGIADDTISDLIDLKSDELSDDVSTMYTTVYTKMAADGITVPEEQSFGDEEFDAAFDYLYSNDVDFKALVDGMIVDFPQIGDDISDFKETFAEKSVDDILELDSEINAAIDNFSTAACGRLDLSPDSVYTLNSGFCTYKNLISSIIKKSSLRTTDEMLDIQGKDYEGNPDLSISYTADELIEEIKTNFASTTAWAQGFLSLEAGDVTAALAKFEAQIGTIISNTQERFASTVAQVKGLLSSTNAKVGSFLDAASEWLGFNQIKDDTFTSVDATDIMSYTGASPLAGINLKTAKGVVQATGKAVAAVAVAAWEGIKALGKKLWKKVKPVVMAITDNPIDIEISDSSDRSYAIGNFIYSFKELSVSMGLYEDYVGSSITQDYARKWQQVLDSIDDKWVGIETYFFETCFKISNGRVNHTGNSWSLIFDIEVKYRSRIANVQKAIDYGILKVSNGILQSQTVSTLTPQLWQRYSDFIATGDLWYDDISDENGMLAGLIGSLIISNDALTYVWDELASNFESIYEHKPTNVSLTSAHANILPTNQDTASTITGGLLYFGRPAIQMYHFAGDSWKPSSVTNADFIVNSCGFIKSAGDNNFKWVGNYHRLPGTETSDYTESVSLMAIVGQLAALFLMQQFDRLLNPTDYLFLPYCKGSYDFSDGRYHIKTDAQNKNVAQVLFNALVVIAVIIAAVLICKSLLKIRRTKKIAKMSNYMGQQDNAIWSQNKTLSYREQRKYLRYSRKVEKLTGASSGLLGSSSTSSIMSTAVSTVKDHVVNNTDIPATIANGQWTQKQATAVQDSAGTVSEIKRLIVGY